ncbi:16S rRNA (cytosine(1402)-N(4))-methyltransferase RsmH [Candidatus Dojkabacteria bacterium]|jgi:16S rRNA (cytosine1402-N4)-methyltransferase|nr:16S rRNA (cytosine(1402)-N(4))-methyltransferase RsmH [Candidatus Dojkabacteria bacterium]
MKSYHIPVLLNESLELLNINPKGTYVDCTLGEGGHSFAIYQKLNGGKLISIDADQNAVDFVLETYGKKENWEIVRSNFSKVKEVCKQAKPDGILMDLGISSRQLEGVKRGFSYNQKEEELDMRMDETLGVKALDLLNALSEKDLTNLFFSLGEEKYSRRIAKEIKKRGDIKTVGDLTSLVLKVVPAANLRNDNHNPARRVFQALRIAVNDELGSLETGLEGGFEILNRNGRLVVITFHSLEDRIVKKFFEEKVKNGEALKVIDFQIPSKAELSRNDRAHSAKIRCIEKNN